MKNFSLKNTAFALIGVGMLALGIATTFDTAPDGTHNIGLMQAQMLWAHFSSTALLVGALMFVANHLAEAMARTLRETR